MHRSNNSCCGIWLQAPVEKKLPLSMTVGTLKTLMSKLFKCHPALQHLAFRPKGVYPSPLDNDMQTLSFYGVCDGGDILLEEIGETTARRELCVFCMTQTTFPTCARP